jgi:hypothetical protein
MREFVNAEKHRAEGGASRNTIAVGEKNWKDLVLL